MAKSKRLSSKCGLDGSCLMTVTLPSALLLTGILPPVPQTILKMFWEMKSTSGSVRSLKFISDKFFSPISNKFWSYCQFVNFNWFFFLSLAGCYVETTERCSIIEIFITVLAACSALINRPFIAQLGIWHQLYFRNYCDTTHHNHHTRRNLSYNSACRSRRAIAQISLLFPS